MVVSVTIHVLGVVEVETGVVDVVEVEIGVVDDVVEVVLTSRVEPISVVRVTIFVSVSVEVGMYVASLVGGMSISLNDREAMESTRILT